MKNKGIDFSGWLAIAVLTILATGIVGYVRNIIHLLGHSGDWGVMELLRGIGVLTAPLGAIMGFVG